jgi:Rne/Rng family ribonuclease
MSKELVIGSNRHETKVAVLEDDQLVELYFQRGNEYSLAGSIHKGRVTRVLPGMQSAFVDLGLERDTFLYVSDFFDEHEDIDALGDDKPVRADRRDPRRERAAERAPEGSVRESNESPSTEAPVIEAAESGNPNPEGTSPPVSGPDSKLSGARASERTEDDRGFRGDRRGRRSRRRRPRSQGFPESKYAPAAGSQSSPISSTEVRTGDEGDSGDVVLLPGESLAKYREMSTASPGGSESFDREETSFDESETSGDSDLPGESDAEVHEDLEAQVEEIELTDKVLTHHDEPSTAAVEEKLEEVKQDLPVSDMTAAEEQQTEPESQYPRSIDALESEEFDLSPSTSLGANVVPIDEGSEPSFSSSSKGTDDEGLPHESATEPRQTAALSEPQNPMLRDQSGRYMHRMPRRMRRRRGGNRFNSAPEITAIGSSSVAGPANTAEIEPERRTAALPDNSEERSASRPDQVAPSIADLLKPGQEIIVQIAKEPLGQKGARITSHVALPGRYVVFMPSVSHAGVSRKIASEEERHRLKRILHKHRVGTTGGFIVRTAGEGISEEEIAADMNFLYNLWMDIRQKAEKKPAPVLLHYDLDVVQRILRDRLTEDFKAIWVDNEEMYESVITFMQRFQPPLVSRVKMYTRSAPIFDAFNVTQELEKALRPKVWLKSGGYIVINQTEALVAIDINTGKFVGKSNRLEDTIVKTNTEAVKEIVRQIRLRDLGGIIVVDFIDMDERRNRQKVMQTLEEAMRADRAPYKILQFNDFGLVAITRKRVKQSLERVLCAPCPYCDGAGYIKSVHTVVSEILVEAQKIAKSIEGKDVVLRANPAVAKVLKSSHNRYLEEIEEILGRPVLVTSDASLHHEKFDLA